MSAHPEAAPDSRQWPGVGAGPRVLRTQGSWEHEKGNHSLSSEPELDNRNRQLLLGKEL